MEVLKELDKMNYTFVKSYPLSHVITMSDDEIRLCVYTIVVDYETLTNHFDEFLRVIKILKEEGTTKEELGRDKFLEGNNRNKLWNIWLYKIYKRTL